MSQTLHWCPKSSALTSRSEAAVKTSSYANQIVTSHTILVFTWHLPWFQILPKRGCSWFCAAKAAGAARHLSSYCPLVSVRTRLPTLHASPLELRQEPRLKARDENREPGQQPFVAKSPRQLACSGGAHRLQSAEEARARFFGGVYPAIDSTLPTIFAATSIVSLRGVLALSKGLSKGCHALP